MDLNELTSEQLQKAKACKTPQDILALAKEEGYELSDAELDAVAGGDFWDVDWDWCSDKGPCTRWFPK